MTSFLRKNLIFEFTEDEDGYYKSVGAEESRKKKEDLNPSNNSSETVSKKPVNIIHGTLKRSVVEPTQVEDFLVEEFKNHFDSSDGLEETFTFFTVE